MCENLLASFFCIIENLKYSIPLEVSLGLTHECFRRWGIHNQYNLIVILIFVSFYWIHIDDVFGDCLLTAQG